MPTSSGIGYQGVLMHDSVEDAVQCSLCGWWGPCLWKHIQSAHKGMNAKKYKEEFGLARGTALCSEKVRENFLNAALLRAKKLGKKENARRIRLMHKALRKRGRKFPKRSMEFKNKHGRCPQQLLERITKLAQKIGHQPSSLELCKHEKDGYGLRQSINLTFGSWNNAIKMLGWEKFNYKASRRTPEQINEYKTHLLMMLRIFKEKHGREATQSDTRRGLLPNWKTYEKYFGSMEKARRISVSPTPY